MTNTEARATPNWLRLLTAVGSPIALTTALLFYFGWVRTRFQARALGYDPSVLDLSVQDYLLKSINVLFLPLVVLVVGFLVLHQQHRRLIAAAQRNSRIRSATVRASRLMIWSWPIWLAMAIVLIVLPATELIAIPASLTVGAVLALYGNSLARTLEVGTHWPPITTALVYVLLAFAVFWDTERVARATGEAFAKDILAFPHQLVAVTVYSEKRLEIDAPGTTESKLGADSAYTFRYIGLRLLEGSRDRYVLLNERGGHVIVLRDEHGLRFEFSGY
jgi:Ca2+/H+ antiporter